MGTKYYFHSKLRDLYLRVSDLEIVSEPAPEHPLVGSALHIKWYITIHCILNHLKESQISKWTCCSRALRSSHYLNFPKLKCYNVKRKPSSSWGHSNSSRVCWWPCWVSNWLLSCLSRCHGRVTELIKSYYVPTVYKNMTLSLQRQVLDNEALRAWGQRWEAGWWSLSLSRKGCPLWTRCWHQDGTVVLFLGNHWHLTSKPFPKDTTSFAHKFLFSG